jgi:hexosaminidase
MNLKFFVVMISAGILVSIVPGLQVAAHGDINLSVADLDLSYHPDRGATLSVFDIPVIGGSSLWVVKTGWTGHIYGAPMQPGLLNEATIEDVIGGKRLTLHHYLSPEETSVFTGTETYTLLRSNVLKIKIEFTYTGNDSAIYEWKLGEIKPLPIIGQPWQASFGANQQNGIIPLIATSSDFGASMVARAFDEINIDSRLGRFIIDPDTSTPLSFSDYRKNHWATSSNPYFWLGMTGTAIEPGRSYSHEVILRFASDPGGGAIITEPQVHSVGTTSVSNARTPNRNPQFITPRPKSLEFTSALFPLGSTVALYLGNEPSGEILQAIDFFTTEMQDMYGIEVVPLEAAPAPGNLPEGSLLLGEPGRFPLPLTLCQAEGLSLPSHAEGYVLSAEDQYCAIAASQPKGLFYGLMSLLQLIHIDPEGISFKGARIRDYPSLSMRGVHCLSGKNAGDQIAKAVRTLLARHKMNTLVWECEYLKWDSQPEIHHFAYGMDKWDAQKVIDTADQNFIEIIPLVQSLGHSEWIFANGRNLDLAEDPEHPYAYCPTNPDTYTFIFSVYQEALDFFQPRVFHIGHDEVTNEGRFPWRSLSSGKTETELIMEDIEKLHEWFTDRDVQVMLWGDTLLYSTEASSAAHAPSLEEAQIRRERLPEDVFIADWHYDASEPEGYTSLDVFRSEGFSAVGASWYNQNNIRNLAKACVDKQAEGLIQTTWAGFNFRIDDHPGAWYQYWAYLWAAEHAWSGQNTPESELPFIAAERFAELWNEVKPLLEPQSGLLFDLESLHNRRLSDNANREGWAGYGQGLDLSSFPVEQEIFGETRFHIGTQAQGESALMLAGKINPPGEYPDEVQLQMAPRRTPEIHFLLSAPFSAADGTRAGEIEFVYEDGSSSLLELVYGQNLFAFDDLRPGLNSNSPIVWKGSSSLGHVLGVRNLCWTNPAPGQPLQKIILKSDRTEAAPTFLAITAVAEVGTANWRVY